MASKALYVVGQRRFVQTMRKAGADMDELKDVNAAAARIGFLSPQFLEKIGRETLENQRNAADLVLSDLLALESLHHCST